MPIEMPRGLPFSVDTWSPASNRKRYHFLTHAHRDHLSGVSSHSSYPIYSTHLTRILTRHYFPQVGDSLFVEIEIGKSVVINDPDGAFSVTAFDANHCPGAVMFLFEGEFGNILHTGDCRLNPDSLQFLPMKYIVKNGKESVCHLDYLFLDCTFGRCPLKLPSEHSAIQQVINCIWKHPNAPVVYLASDLLGQEEILVEVSRTFGSKIYVDKMKNAECFQALSLIAPQILSQDASSRFQVVEGFPRLYERASEKLAVARANLQPEPLFVRPSAQWYAGNENLETTERQSLRLTEAVRDNFGVWHVCYSKHSSREELEWALQLLRPKWVISTTPPCRAMELDYVKNHCFKTNITSDDPLWKLLKVRTGKSKSLSDSTVSQVLKNGNSTTTTTEVEVSTTADCHQLQLTNLPTNQFELKLDLSPESRAGAITLFGRARLGLQDPNVLLEEKKIWPTISQNKAKVFALQEQELSLQGNNTAGSGVAVLVSSSPREETVAERVSFLQEDNIAESGVVVPVSPLQEETVAKKASFQKDNIAELSFDKSKEEVVSKRDAWCIGSSKSYNASLRKLYRSMNVPVPRPLPPLVELMGISKRVKFSSEPSFNKPTYCSASP